MIFGNPQMVAAGFQGEGLIDGQVVDERRRVAERLQAAGAVEPGGLTMTQVPNSL